MPDTDIEEMMQMKAALTEAETRQVAAATLDEALTIIIEAWKQRMSVWDLSEADLESILKSTLTYIANGRKWISL